MNSSGLSRRNLLAGMAVSVPLLQASSALSFAPHDLVGSALSTRSKAALDVRNRAATTQSFRALASMKSNGEEEALPSRIACFSKGLPKNQFGEVEPAAYLALLSAIRSGKFKDFESIPRAGGRHLGNPQSAYAFHLEGGDPHTFDIPPAPTINSADGIWEMEELYWQALCRDVPFAEYNSSPLIQQAAAQLQTQPGAIFRGTWKGNLSGPYISQFLLKPIPYGAGRIEQKYNVPIPKSDFMTTFSEWSQIQLGFQPWLAASYETAPRYIRTGRDLAEYVHYDFAYQAYLGAALILINSNAKSIHNCNQFRSSNNPYRYSTVEDGFTTFGPAEAADWVGRATTAALKAAFCQKWMVHRRLRPEALGGLIHQTRIGSRLYPLPESLPSVEVVDRTFRQTGSYLLPQAFPEGSPIHPSYPSGHAAIAGACAVILKACFDGQMLLPGVVEPTPDGAALKPCPDFSPTVQDEIDKLAFNVSMGRNWAGIHFRSDNDAGLALGENVGISILQDLACTFTEDFKGFSFRRFNGIWVKITPQGQLIEESSQT